MKDSDSKPAIKGLPPKDGTTKPETKAEAPIPLDQLNFAAGERIFSQGEMGDAAYILKKGRIALFQTHEGQKVEIGEIAAGNIFGEMAVLDAGVRSASAIAVIDCEVTRVPVDVFEKKMASCDRFLRAIIELFIRNLRGAPRLFVRRPRSVKDHIRQIRQMGGNLRGYSRRLEDANTKASLTEKLDRLDILVRELMELSSNLPDKRHDLIIEDGDGVDLSEVIGTEGQRVI